MGSSGVTYPTARLRRSSRMSRIARGLGLEPFFLAALAVTVSAGAAVGVTVAALGSPPPVGASVAATAEPIVTAPPPFESFWMMPIVVDHGRPVGGVQRLEVNQNDHVAIGVDLDRSATLSVDGYGLWTYVHPNEKGLLELVAWEWGR